MLVNVIINSMNIHTMLILIFIYSNNFRHSENKKFIINQIVPLIITLILAVLVMHISIMPNTEPTKFFLYILSIIGIVLNIVSVAIILIYLKMQNKSAEIDYLTGAYNRRYLDRYINKIIHSCKSTKTFSCILIDLDKFKQTNDIFGHGVGDEILKATVELLKKCINKKDIVARYGGDEFYIVLHIDNIYALEGLVDKIKNSFDEYNYTSNKPYKIYYSIGYDIYDYNLWNDCESFQNHIDKLMYNNKKVKDKQKICL